MNRRDVLKMIGIGGLVPFIKHEEVEAAPLPEVPTPLTARVGYPHAMSGTAWDGEPFPMLGSATWRYVGTDVVFPFQSQVIHAETNGFLNVNDNGDNA